MSTKVKVSGKKVKVTGAPGTMTKTGRMNKTRGTMMVGRPKGIMNAMMGQKKMKTQMMTTATMMVGRPKGSMNAMMSKGQKR